MQRSYSYEIARILNLKPEHVSAVIEMLAEGATIPFIARYRKERTGIMDEVNIAGVRDLKKQMEELDKRREAILESIDEQGFTSKELVEKINNAASMSELEDLYLPYKPKRKTRASIAIEKGLEPLAKIIMSQNSRLTEFDFDRWASKTKAENGEDAKKGALDIIAEWISENVGIRNQMRRHFMKKSAIISAKAKDAKDEEGKYKAWYDWEENFFNAPSHRVLAMLRGENEGILKLKIGPDAEESIEIIEQKIIRSDSASEDLLRIAIKDSYKRLLAPSMETELRSEVKAKADKEAIRIFRINLKQLLLAPPLGQKRVLAIDPGFRTGCKVVVLDEQGKLLHNETIYPHPPQREFALATKKLDTLVSQFKIEAIAVGNGTAGRETETLVRNTRFSRDVKAIMVNENGASVYSASKVARDEFPNYDVTVRGAVSIGRRLMDPLAELVKIDPKSIGVGQYQHDVDQKQLQEGLEEEVVSSVNSVGVELNTASKELLSYISGVGPVLASKIVEYREENGAFKSRSELKKVPRLGDKVFEQAAGFIRIRNSSNPLDNTAVHPESYDIVKNILKKSKLELTELLGKKEILRSLNPEEFVTAKAGLPTIKDILSELEKPGRDPRMNLEVFDFDRSVHSINDLHVGMVLPGIVTNITAFGAFVDVGAHQDGLVHISELADRFISDVNEIVKLNQHVTVKVTEVNIERKRVQLSMKGIVG